jgi:NADP-dependent 3-hydroxy acid dehydrogenase YdfG/Tfp pilus assembly protein PilF
MDKIILAYCRDNADLAQKIDANLSKVGIPFEHLTNQPGAMPGQFAAWVQSTNSPVILLITDNFLKSQSCMAAALVMMQQLIRSERVLTVVADGKIDHGDGDYERTQTQFDRVVHAIQYMNYWQSTYLELRAQKEFITPDDAELFDSRSHIVRDISSEIGEFLNLLRDSSYIKMTDFEADSYRIFFKKYGLMEWHEQYSLLDAKVTTNYQPSAAHPSAAVHIVQPAFSNSLSANQQKETTPVVVQTLESLSAIHSVESENQTNFEENRFNFSDSEDVVTEIMNDEYPLPNSENENFSTPENFENNETLESIFEEEIVPIKSVTEPILEVPLASNTIEPNFVEPTVSVDIIPAFVPVFENPISKEKIEVQKLEPIVNKEETDKIEAINRVLSSAQRPIVSRIISSTTQSIATTPKLTPQTNAEYIALTIKDAEYWLEKGQLEQAFKAYELAINDFPDDSLLQKSYLNALLKHGRLEKAALFLEKHYQNPEKHAQELDNLAEMCAAKGEVVSARYFWEKLALVNPTHPDIFYKLGKLAENSSVENHFAAREYLKMAVKQTPENGEIHYHLAKILLPHKPKKAIKYLLNTVSIEPKHPTAWMDLAEAYQKIEENDNAATCFRKAVELNPNLNTEINQKKFIPVFIDKNQDVSLVQKQGVASKKEILTVLITGATSGIGKATAEMFAQNGHRLILVGRREDRLSELKTSFEVNYKNEVLTLTLDIRDYKSVEAVFNEMPENWQNIDILLNNAGLAKGLDFIHEGNLEHWETMIDTNIKGLLYVTRLISPMMVRRRKGHIINISSTAGKEVYPKGNVYCATKHAVEALTKAMRLDLHNHNIRVSEVSPGQVEETEFALTRFDGDAEKAKIYNDFRPLKSSDVAEIIYFISTRPSYVNIQDVLVMGTQQASSTIVDRSGR